jgi:hypothetical protein
LGHLLIFFEDLERYFQRNRTEVGDFIRDALQIFLVEITKYYRRGIFA